MNRAQRQAIVDAEARYAVASGDVGARRRAMADRIAAKVAARPPVDANGYPLRPNPDDTDPGGTSLPAAA